MKLKTDLCIALGPILWVLTFIDLLFLLQHSANALGGIDDRYVVSVGVVLLAIDVPLAGVWGALYASLERQ